MSNKLHHMILGCVWVAIAAVSAFTVHNILSGSARYNNMAKSSSQSVSRLTITPSVDIHFPKNQYGVYLLPTADPTYPLRLGPKTVGGVTACERLNNLTLCLREKQSSLESRLRAPEATAGAGLETACGNVLNDLADLRPATTTIGCIW